MSSNVNRFLKKASPGGGAGEVEGVRAAAVVKKTDGWSRWRLLYDLLPHSI